MIWALALEGQGVPDRAANLAYFVGETYTGLQLSTMSAEDFSKMKRRALEALPRATYPCGSLSKIEAVAKLLGSS